MELGKTLIDDGFRDDCEERRNDLNKLVDELKKDYPDLPGSAYFRMAHIIKEASLTITAICTINKVENFLSNMPMFLDGLVGLIVRYSQKPDEFGERS